MSFNGSGVYSLPGPQLASGETVSATENNQFRNDVEGAFNVTFCRDGEALPTANWDMNGFKLTGLPAGTTNGDSVRYEQVTSDVAITGGTITGIELEINWETPGAIGATTPNTGEFTSLTAESAQFDLAKAIVYQETKTEIVAEDINLDLANYFSKTVSGDVAFTVSNTPTTGTVASFILDLTNGGSYTITWWSGLEWASGSPPILTSGRDVLGFFTYDGGITWTGLLLSRDVK